MFFVMVEWKFVQTYAPLATSPTWL
jgi:hypothetical protein